MLDNTGYGPSPSRRGSGNRLTHTIMAVLGPRSPQVLLAFYNPGSGGSGISLPGSGAVPAPAPRYQAFNLGGQPVCAPGRSGLFGAGLGEGAARPQVGAGAVVVEDAQDLRGF